MGSYGVRTSKEPNLPALYLLLLVRGPGLKQLEDAGGCKPSIGINVEDVLLQAMGHICCHTKTYLSRDRPLGEPEPSRRAQNGSPPPHQISSRYQRHEWAPRLEFKSRSSPPSFSLPSSEITGCWQKLPQRPRTMHPPPPSLLAAGRRCTWVLPLPGAPTISVTSPV